MVGGLNLYLKMELSQNQMVESSIAIPYSSSRNAKAHESGTFDLNAVGCLQCPLHITIMGHLRFIEKGRAEGACYQLNCLVSIFGVPTG